MPTQETKILDNIIASRRNLLMGGGALMAALAMPKASLAAATVATYTDNDILNFALNLEYLEANFYYLAAFGTTIDQPSAAATAAGAQKLSLNGVLGSGSNQNLAAGIQASFSGTMASNMVPFQIPLVQAYATETAIEEGKHVNFLRTALGSAAVAQPALNLTIANFQALAGAAKIAIASSYNPYANDLYFLLGAYIFEDVGVSAYHGAAPLITGKTTILPAAVGIHAVEAYHAGLVRTTINSIDSGALTLPAGLLPYTSGTLSSVSQQISALRNTLAQQLPQSPANPEDPSPDDYGVVNQMVTLPTVGSVVATQIVDADPKMETSFARSTAQVLNIVTGGAATSAGKPATGIFYPNGLNGLFI